ncbi:HTTM domain-containing protein [Flavobacterium litorale]|uniref:HTTM domain-containing protein n=1 Tax=Flavobacterium litorale TaxID=2856519 RepID=A0ABX8V8R1_9FLAO|nr:HTTM domain-containing protein [Flavobacterium litorale]QYJ69229.1 HTTM domain-containing protein [Flavobacterium litorale]
MKNYLYKEIDNAPLIIFRIFFGFLLACETWGAILTGWVKANFIDVQFTYSHIGMDWLQPLPGYGMYFYFAVMGIMGIMVMLGYKYRWSMGLFTIMWSGVYFMQKTSYNNHYYLLVLICLVMFLLPANRYAAIDAKQNPSIKKLTMPAWCSLVMVAQVAIVYFYATVAKFYPDWLDGTFTRNLLNRSTSGAFHDFAMQEWFYLFIAYAGIAFDMLIIPLLLYKRTRTIALVASLIFHLFNSITLEIGIFPFFALTFVVFFYPPERMRRLFFKNKPQVTDYGTTTEKRSTLLYFFIPYIIIQLLLPIRHHFIKGDVLWTEEGHRLSWRMMLRSRGGYTYFKVVNKANNQIIPYHMRDKATPKQIASMRTKPDMIWQTAQRIKKEFAATGLNVAVYADTRVSINGAPLKKLIDEDTDLAAAEWDYFFHNDWIILYDDEGKRID